MIFDLNIIQKAIDLHNVQGRSSWKYASITDRQCELLKSHIPQEFMNKIDRGAASLLISCIISQRQQDSAYGRLNTPWFDEYDHESDDI